MRHPVQRSLLCGKCNCLWCECKTLFSQYELFRWPTLSASKSQVRSAEMWRSRSARMCPSWLASGGTFLMMHSLLLDFVLYHMVVCRKKPNTKCSSVPHRVCELVTMIPYLSVAIPLNTGEGLCMFQTAPWDLPPSDYEQVWKVAGDQVQVAVLKRVRDLVSKLFSQAGT